ncbi:SAM-dependent methyltransferase [Bdellovibrio bacteriovorus]|uniref:SAM-dependent methyltransferase n=1 Tax=Bdellovibrio bacteriovorus TaxID=959 RepID=UPI0021CE60F2|nr:SAM-dependent methyltransferase [Bdellovibrio bacteriovorus]UXR63995.1 SAM-dependent methyltransferase [Bdellovibrio bacteriovorus]
MENNLFLSYSSQTDISHRKKFGQFFTPLVIAKFMARWLLANKHQNFLDPAFGLGIFVEQLEGFKDFKSLMAYEVDNHIYSFAKAHFSADYISLKNSDYLQDWGLGEIDAVICNPPYMKFQNFTEKDEILANIQKNLGIKVSGYTNTASAFLLKSVSELKEGGRLAYIMPFEFMNAGYGEAVKDYLLRSGEIEAFIQVDCEKEAFSEVVTSVGIILFHKKKNPNKDISFFAVKSLDELGHFEKIIPIRTVSRKLIQARDKWAKYFSKEEINLKFEHLVPLKSYGNFSRGIATGANSYFSFSESKVRQNNMPKSSLVPCITKSNQIKGAIFDQSDLNKLISLDSEIYLVNLESNSSSDDIKRYIAQGEKDGIHLRYLTKMRSPWYKLEKRKPSGLLFGVFSRNGYKVIRNTTEAVCLTCYHGFNLKADYSKYLDLLFFYLLSDAGNKIMQINMRKYGDGLDKFEPNDLNDSLVPSPEWFSSVDKIDIKAELEIIKGTGKISFSLNQIFEDLLK